MYTCQENEVYDHYKTPPGCVNINSLNGKKVMTRKARCENDPEKIINPFTGRCINKNSKTAKDVLNRIQKVNIEQNRPVMIKNEQNRSVRIKNEKDKDNCKKAIEDNLHQCQCPICWIVSSISIIKYSGLSKYFTPFYKNQLDTIYNIFTDPDKDGTICPRLPRELAAEVVSYYPEGRYTIETIFNVGAHELIFLYSFFTLALRKEYDVKIISGDEYFDFEKNTIVLLELEMPPGTLFDMEFIKKFLKNTKKKYSERGYEFKAGIFSVTEFKGTGHAITWKYCNSKFYLCNSDGGPCTELGDTEETRLRITPYYETIESIKFILYKV